MIAIVNYGVGNLNSIRNMFKKIGLEATITSQPGEIEQASGIILPGVGAFDHCMKTFNESGLREVVTKKVLEEKTPVLGICVGLQMMTEGSEEGVEPGLGWIKGKVIHFKEDKVGNLKLPHMAWTNVHARKGSSITKEFANDTRFYFVHSYHVQLDDPKDELLTAEYGYPFTAGIEKENIRGVQFHPEKSHRFGMKLLENFSKLCS